MSQQESTLKSYQEERLDLFRKTNQTLKKGGLVFAGDSITEFYSLKKFLGRDLPLINRGIAGTDSIWLLQHFSEQVLELEPSKLFIWIGTNDLGRGYAVSDIVKRISDMVAAVKQTSYFTPIYMLSVLPVNETERYQSKVKIRKNTDIQTLNQSLQVLAGIEFIDLYPLLLDETGNLAADYTIDGLHLTQEAYAKISNILKLYLD